MPRPIRPIDITMVVRADVVDDVEHARDYGPHELADVIRFHLGQSHLDDLDVDISAFMLTEVREAPRPIRPGDLVTHRVQDHLDPREVVSVGRDFLTLDVLGVETERLPLDNYVLDTPADGVL